MAADSDVQRANTGPLMQKKKCIWLHLSSNMITKCSIIKNLIRFVIFKTHVELTVVFQLVRRRCVLYDKCLEYIPPKRPSKENTRDPNSAILLPRDIALLVWLRAKVIDISKGDEPYVVKHCEKSKLPVMKAFAAFSRKDNLFNRL